MIFYHRAFFDIKLNKSVLTVIAKFGELSAMIA